MWLVSRLRASALASLLLTLANPPSATANGSTAMPPRLPHLDTKMPRLTERIVRTHVLEGGQVLDRLEL
jgi:hypothetical protein